MLISNAVVAQQLKVTWEWEYLAPIPDPIGYAGAYIGTVNDFLVVSGGANFPDGKAPWEGGKKVWTDRTFILTEKSGTWIEAKKLPQPMGYGATVSYRDKMYVAGGSDTNTHIDSVYEISWDAANKDLAFRSLPKLPKPIANCSSVLIGNYWYILGGIISPAAKEAEKNCWRLDLHRPEQGWESISELPSPGRMLAVAGNRNGHLVLLSGVALQDGRRTYLKDAYQLDNQGKWSRLKDLPISVAAAAGPALYHPASSSLYVVGGDDGSLAQADLKHQHPGFSSHILQFDGNDWLQHSEVKLSDSTKVWVPVTTGAIIWKGNYVLASGEIRPGIRSPKVLMGHLIVK